MRIISFWIAIYGKNPFNKILFYKAQFRRLLIKRLFFEYHTIAVLKKNTVNFTWFFVKDRS